MFGMGILEILLIAIVAIVALGPEKLPTAMVEVAKFLKKFKSGVEDAKSTLDNELNISEMKAEANKFKAQIAEAKTSMSIDSSDLGIDNILKDDISSSFDDNGILKDKKDDKKEKSEPKTVKKEKKIKKKKVEEKNDEESK